ncbi:MAG: lysophospholipid acyltransferase family protein, partial [Actinomycetota bacterium]
MSLPAEIGRFQRLVAALVRPPLHAYFRLEIRGIEHVPGRGPAILAPKHDSMWDVPFVAVTSPRTVLFMAKEDVFGNPFKRWFFTELGGFPVRRGKGDAAAIRAARAVLRSGRVLGIFPEGTRHPNGLGPLHTGAARLALASGAPLIPVGLTGTGEIWSGSVPRPVPVTVTFGPSVDASD